MILLLLACDDAPPPMAPPDACTIMGTPAPGPLAADLAAAGDDALAQARVRIREARLTSDPGFYTLADTALSCALSRSPTDVEAARLQVHLLVQFHRFAEAEAAARALPGDHWLDQALLGDALMERGDLDAAAVAYQAAVDRRPGLEMYDRIGWLRWSWGDVDGALQMQASAVSAGSPQDPEPFAWVLTRMGWLHALRGEPAAEIEQALTLLPDYPPARFARGRIRLHAGDTVGAAADLRAVGATVEAVRALSEIGPADVEAVRAQDPRGYALWLADRDPARAIPVLEEEWTVRQDAMTQMALAYARFRAGQPASDPRAEEQARAALATGIAEPRVLLLGGLILGDDALVTRALATGPGLLPSERKLVP